MKQTRLMSFVKAFANVVGGYEIAVLTQLMVLPWFGLPARPRCAGDRRHLYCGVHRQRIRAPAAFRDPANAAAADGHWPELTPAA